MGKLPYPIPAIAQHTISVLKILSDGNWHTSGAIAQELGIGKKYVRDILKACKKPWGLVSSRKNGWKIISFEESNYFKDNRPK